MLYNYVYGFFYGFVHNHNYTYDAKTSKTTNRLSFTSYTYDALHQCSAQAFNNMDCEYDYFSNVNNLTQYNYDTIAMVSHAATEQRHCYSNYIRYKFTGKEQDEATGFYYTSTCSAHSFGARYYSSNLSIWLSVDPLSYMYPSTSPYAYVNNNPIMLIDESGLTPGPIKKIKQWYKRRQRGVKVKKVPHVTKEVELIISTYRMQIDSESISWVLVVTILILLNLMEKKEEELYLEEEQKFLKQIGLV